MRYDRASDHNNLCGVRLTMGLVHKDLAEQARKAGNSAKAAEESRYQARALEAAMKEDDIALQCDPNFVGAWQTRAEIFAAQDKPEEIVKCYERIVEIDPTGEGVRFTNKLFEYYYNQKKDVDNSLACLDKAGSQFSKTVNGKAVTAEFIGMPFFLANAYATLKQTDKGIHWLDLAGQYVHTMMGERPGSQNAAQIWLQIAAKYLELKQPDKTIAWSSEVLAVAGAVPAAINLRAAASEMKGDLVRAKADYEQLFKLVPQAPGIEDKLRKLNEELSKPK